MEESLRPHHAVPPSPDPHAYGRCTPELTQTRSDTSAVTVDTSKHNSQLLSPSFKSMKWTNQRHREYLNYLETSFVHQLHQSWLLRGWHTQNSSRDFVRKLPDQHLVLQEGCCQKMSFERNEPMLESTADSHVIAGSPLRHHAETFENGCFVRESDAYDSDLLCDDNLARNVKSPCTSPSSEKRSSHICCLNVAGTSAEATDQNFVEEDLGNKSKAKKLKISSDEASNNDQVVPVGNFQEANVSSDTDTSSGIDGQRDLLSENPENFFFSRSNEHYFLRGS